MDSEYVGTHVDTGNSMFIWEEPIEAIRNMAPYAISTHFKDHTVIMVGGQPVVVGVPLGKGSIDCAEAFRILAEQSPLERINIEVCYGYVAPFRLPEGEGHGAKLGRGSFRVQPPPHDPSVIARYTSRSLDTDVELQSWAWQDMAKLARAEEERGELLALQAQAVIDSVAYVKRAEPSRPSSFVRRPKSIFSFSGVSSRRRTTAPSSPWLRTARQNTPPPQRFPPPRTPQVDSRRR